MRLLLPEPTSPQASAPLLWQRYLHPAAHVGTSVTDAANQLCPLWSQQRIGRRTLNMKGWTSRWHNAPQASICACEDITSASPVVSTRAYSFLAGRRGYRITRKLPTFKICFAELVYALWRPPSHANPFSLASERPDVFRCMETAALKCGNVLLA